MGLSRGGHWRTRLPAFGAWGLGLAALVGMTMATPHVVAAQADPSTSAEVRRVVLAGIMNALAREIAAAARDTVMRPWDLFGNDSTGTWTEERHVLSRALRARPHLPTDRRWNDLGVGKVAVHGDTIEASFSIDYNTQCARMTTANGADLRITALRTTPLAQVKPVYTQYWDGMPCRLLDTLRIREAPKPPR